MISGKEKELGIFYNEDFDSAAQEVCKVVNQWDTWRGLHNALTQYLSYLSVLVLINFPGLLDQMQTKC